MVEISSSEVSALEAEAMRRALELAGAPEHPLGPNPRVGAVLLGATGEVLGEGAHQGAGSPHAEVVALARAARRAQGATVVVTLEPCAHHGRTGPCTEALIDAGVRRVVYAMDDPSPQAGSGAVRLRSAGVEVVGGLLADESCALNPGWLRATRGRRPYLVWKVAASLDGRIAAADGSSRWISCDESRHEVHLLRGEVEAIVTGTGTVHADNPSLTARPTIGEPEGPQPRRIVMGVSDIPRDAKVLDDSAPTEHLRTRDVRAVVRRLHEDGVRYGLLECGPRLAASFVDADLIDEIRWYVAPILLGSGVSVLTDIGVSTVTDARRFDVVDTSRVGSDVRIRLVAREN